MDAHGSVRYNNAESYWLLGKAMAANMLQLLAPLPPRPPPGPPPPPAPPPPPRQDMVIIYQQGGNGTLKLGRSNFSATVGMPGKGWDACPGAGGPAKFDNGAPVRRPAVCYESRIFVLSSRFFADL